MPPYGLLPPFPYMLLLPHPYRLLAPFLPVGSQGPPTYGILVPPPHQEALGNPSPLLGSTTLPQECVSMGILATLCVVDACSLSEVFLF